jgi:hypothetical protein
VLATVLLLLPCFWGAYIQAGDLSSHIYNSWLAQLVQTGKVSGLTLASQSTNILFDLILSGLFRSLGAATAQRIAVSLAVLVFVWGAFALASAASGRRAWAVLPCIAMLAYGWVFHMGFFDFYLSLGLCFCGLAAAWDPTPKRVAIAAPFFLLAFLAHALAFAWGAGLLAYLVAAKYVGDQRRLQLTAVGVIAILAGRIAVGSLWRTRWTAAQIQLITGADQLQVFAAKYTLFFIALLLLWVILFVSLIRSQTKSALLSGLPLQLCILSAAAVFLLPGRIDIPGYRHGLVYIAERMSLTVGICLCALLASAKIGQAQRWSMAILAAVFFLMLFRDESALNAFEQQIGRAVASLPYGQRVLLGLDDDSLTRVNAITHMIDRECIGRCYSYANYEPSTWQFRVRAIAPNPYVASEYRDSILMQGGQYLVKPADLPLYQVSIDNSGRVGLLSLAPRRINGMRFCKVLPDAL